MGKGWSIDSYHTEELSQVGRALSSPVRIGILHLLAEDSYNIAEIAAALDIAASSAASHVVMLEQAGLIYTEQQPGERGTMKLCTSRYDRLEILLTPPSKQRKVHTMSMPVGAFTRGSFVPTCGYLVLGETMAVPFDNPALMYHPQRLKAQLLWSAGGFVEYTFPFPLFAEGAISALTISLEICSEAPNFREDWPSDITFSLNGQECAFWRSPGDFGHRKGLLTPDWWDTSQYGTLLSITVSAQGTQCNGVPASTITVEDLRRLSQDTLVLRIENKEDAQHRGGFNLFGREMGDYPQDIVLSVEYKS